MGKVKLVGYICSFVLFAFSCNKNNSYEIRNEGTYCKDSISLHKIDSHVTLNIGDKIDPMPLKTQLYMDDGLLEYMILDEKKLFIFDIYADTLLKTIKIKNCGNLMNYSGFRYVNKDSILVYDYKDKIMRIIDSESKISRTYRLHENANKISPEALSYSQILINGNKAFLSGIPISKASRLYDTDNISVSVDMADGKLKYGAHFSDEYSKGFFGGVYYNMIYHCMDANNRIIYSFPASNYIYRYDTNLVLIDSLYMGSRYTGNIKCAQEPTLKFMRDEDERIKYFATQDSYSNILYDQYRKTYYRIAEHPTKEHVEDFFPKPFSIIVMNEQGELITETPVIREKYNTGNIHVVKDGIIIQKYTENENLIQFDLFRIGSDCE